MKVLLVGGAFQGKRDYALRRYGEPTIDRMQELTRAELLRGADPRSALLGRLEPLDDWVVVCDEVGSGVIPIEKTDRRWREETGRLCCELARRADIVERITCGIPVRLKGPIEEWTN